MGHLPFMPFCPLNHIDLNSKALLKGFISNLPPCPAPDSGTTPYVTPEAMAEMSRYSVGGTGIEPATYAL